MPGLKTLLFGLAALLSASAPALAQTAPQAPRLRLTPLLGVAVPFGEAVPGRALSDVAPSALLLGADVAWGPLLPLDFGITFGTTLGLGEPDVCPRLSSSCGLALGAQLAARARYYFMARERVTPWLGLGGGFDLLRITGESTTPPSISLDDTSVTERSSTYLGPLGMLTAGVDVRRSRSLSLGGLLALSVAQYFTVKDAVAIDGEAVTSSSGTLEPALHAWLYVAAHVTFDLSL